MKANKVLARRVATAVVGTSLGVAYAVRSRLSALEREGYTPLTHPQCPGHLNVDAELEVPRSAGSSLDFSEFGGLYVSWYSSPLMLEVSSSRTSLVATHLTGSLAVPAGNEAFKAECDTWGNVHGEHAGSFLPYWLWLTTAPCRVNVYYEDLSRRSVNPNVLSVDLFVMDWLPPIRVPMLRVPTGVYVERDAVGAVPNDGPGLAAAERAIADARFTEELGIAS